MLTDGPAVYYTLRASAGSFYVIEGEQARLPCPSWPAINTTCEVKWYKVYAFSRPLLLSSDKMNAEFDGLDFTSDFGLIIDSVGRHHAGEYRCEVGSGHGENIEVSVIGECT